MTELNRETYIALVKMRVDSFLRVCFAGTNQALFPGSDWANLEYINECLRHNLESKEYGSVEALEVKRLEDK